MVSKTKPELKKSDIQKIFSAACLGEVLYSQKLGDGEYNAAYDVKTNMGSYVLKVSPLDKTGILSYEQDMMRGEVFWYAQLRAHTKIKVPYVYYKDFSHKLFPSDFFIMERMEGQQLNNAKLTNDEKIRCEEEIARAAAQMHKVTNNKYGYIQNGLYDTWHEAIRSMVLNLLKDIERAGKKSARGKKLLDYIDKYSDVLNKAPCAMINFDLWYGNILYVRKNEASELIFIDPERTFWGDPICEFVNLNSGVMLDKKEVTLKAYNETAKIKISCTGEEMIRYAVAIGYLGLILEAEKYYRYTPHHFGWWRNIAGSYFFFSNAFKILK